MYDPVLYTCPLFAGLSREMTDRFLEDAGAAEKSYGKEQILFLASLR